MLSSNVSVNTLTELLRSTKETNHVREESGRSFHTLKMFHCDCCYKTARLLYIIYPAFRIAEPWEMSSPVTDPPDLVWQNSYVWVPASSSILNRCITCMRYLQTRWVLLYNQ